MPNDTDPAASLRSTTSEAPVRWLVLAPIRLPAGQRRRVSSASFRDLMTEAAVAIEHDIGAAIGGTPTRASLEFPRLRSFSTRDVIARIPLLRELTELASRLTGARSHRLSADEALGLIHRLVGDGALVQDLRDLLDPPAPTPARGPADRDGALVDELLANAARRASPRASVQEFIAATRDESPRGASPGALRDRAARALRDRVESAVLSAARALLATPDARAAESLWRGLKLALQQRPGDADVTIELAAGDAADVPAWLQRLDEDSGGELPDGVFVVSATFPDALPELARAGEQYNVPIIVDLDPAALGDDEPPPLDQLPTRLTDDARWTALRSREESRWLCLCVNPPVLAVEEGVNPRRCDGSPALTLLAMLTASARRTGGFAQIVGRDGALRSPASVTIARDPDPAISIPTTSFLPRRAQRALADHGLLALGSRRNSDELRLAAAPTLYRASAPAEKIPLPAQLLTGRVVRFARWVRDQLPAGASSEQVTRIFHDAAGLFLFPRLPETTYRVGAALDVQTSERDATLRVAAAVHPAIAGVHLELEFTLPLSDPASTT